MNGSKNSSAKTGQSEEQPASKGPKRLSFTLKPTGAALDPRIHAYRDDIADIALADRIALPHYVEPVIRQVGQPIANLFAEPSETGELGSQLLFGETFALLDIVDGDWGWGYGLHDHFVGFIRRDALIAPEEPTYIVSVPAASSGAITLYMGSRVADGCTMSPNHTRRIDDPLDDAVAVAEAFIDTPYLLGGRSAEGIDCSGLVQISLAMAGHRVQRDSDLQQTSAGEELADDAALERGDLVFFPDHVGLMIDGETLIHASGHNGKTCTEPLANVVARIGEQHETPVLARRRIAK